MDWQARAALLEDENETLRERVRQLEAELADVEFVPVEWGLTASEATVLGVLVNRDVAGKDAILAGLYRDIGKDVADEQIVDVYISKLRRKLNPYGVEIKTWHGRGWRLDERWREYLRAPQDVPRPEPGAKGIEVRTGRLTVRHTALLEQMAQACGKKPDRLAVEIVQSVLDDDAAAHSEAA